ncbi:hypothetical protein CARUB_v10021600mg [Capsella rubella]|uniref:RING-type E3 ubiquitin transferase n=1 Tax=Capsella rubella TaxID=81985 RepID=R0HW93_9BRAS|nr:hypothetical protein CARUB_v10021600mg [Capsella rubella]
MSLILFDLDLLDRPLFCHPLTSLIFQVSLFFLVYNCFGDGHIACSSCCIMLMRNKCTSCILPIGIYQCRILEKLVEAVILPCPNAKHLVHRDDCGSTLCYFPARNCNYTGVYEDLYYHFIVWHKDCYSSRFRTGQYVDVDIQVNINETMLILHEYHHGPLVIIQSYKGGDGLYVIVNLLASPSTPRDLKFRYDLIYRRGYEQLTYECGEMTRILRLSFEAPALNYMFIPYNALDEGLVVKMEIRIREIGYEEEENDKEEAEEEEDDDNDDEDAEE